MPRVKGRLRSRCQAAAIASALANIAAVFIIFLGVTAALNQIDVATSVTSPILIAVLAIIAGVIIVGAGGGLIKPMQQRWEAIPTKGEEEAPKIAERAKGAPSVAAQAEEAMRTLQQQTQPEAPTQPAAPTRPTLRFRPGREC
ncbi:hypothetical protein [Microbacterium sp. NPDC080220]|uniref:hypothetical protein n=1 Tax=Microbacterium sp. NPDC080220 TaxID=3161017 RepID=UPI003416AEC3